MADNTSSWDWGAVQETLFGIGGLAVSYEEAKNSTSATTATAPQEPSDLPPTPAQITTSTNTSTFMGIDFSKPTNIIGAILITIATIFVIKKA